MTRKEIAYLELQVAHWEEELANARLHHMPTRKILGKFHVAVARLAAARPVK